MLHQRFEQVLFVFDGARSLAHPLFKLSRRLPQTNDDDECASQHRRGDCRQQQQGLSDAGQKVRMSGGCGLIRKQTPLLAKLKSSPGRTHQRQGNDDNSCRGIGLQCGPPCLSTP